MLHFWRRCATFLCAAWWIDLASNRPSQSFFRMVSNSARSIKKLSLGVPLPYPSRFKDDAHLLAKPPIGFCH